MTTPYYYKLTYLRSRLHLGGKMLLRRYSTGEVESVTWPLGSEPWISVHQDKENLAVALRQAIEAGGVDPLFAHDCVFLLPDGTPFDVDKYLPTRTAELAGV